MVMQLMQLMQLMVAHAAHGGLSSSVSKPMASLSRCTLHAWLALEAMIVAAVLMEAEVRMMRDGDEHLSQSCVIESCSS